MGRISDSAPVVAGQQVSVAPRESVGIDYGRLCRILGADQSGDRGIANLPFGVGDVTAGAENELLTVVTGPREQVDLARTVEESNYFKNLLRRAAAGDASKSLVRGIARRGCGDFCCGTQALAEWRQLLDIYSLRQVMQLMVSTSSRANRLRQSSPFFAVLNAEERDKVLSALEETK